MTLWGVFLFLNKKERENFRGNQQQTGAPFTPHPHSHSERGVSSPKGAGATHLPTDLAAGIPCVPEGPPGPASRPPPWAEEGHTSAWLHGRDTGHSSQWLHVTWLILHYLSDCLVPPASPSQVQAQPSCRPLHSGLWLQETADFLSWADLCFSHMSPRTAHNRGEHTRGSHAA